VAPQREPAGRPTTVDRPTPSPAAAPKAPPSAEAEHKAPEPEPQPQRQPEPEPEPVVVVAPAPDAGRVAAIEEQLAAALLRVTEVAEVQRSESASRTQADHALRSELQTIMRQGLAEVRAEVMASAEAAAARMAALEDAVRRSVADVAGALESRRTELDGLTGALAEVRSEVERLTGASQELARTQGDLDRRVGELAGRASGRADEATIQAAEQRIQETLGQVRSEVTALEQKVQADAGTLTRTVEAQRADLEGALDRRIREELAMVGTVVDETGLAQAQLARTVDDLMQQVATTEVRVNAVAASEEDTTMRLHALEQQMQESVRRLTREVRAQRDAMQAMLAATEAPDGGPAADRPSPSPEPGSAPSAGLLYDLERQLQEAESRLARLGDVG
jgi:chromosome segregation ATPase